MKFEYYATPDPFTRWLFREMAQRGTPITGRIFEPCVGDGAIIRAVTHPSIVNQFGPMTWLTNDLDPRWPADLHFDASGRLPVSWDKDELAGIDWTVTNPPFESAIEIIEKALMYSKVGVAMHLRASIHEVLKTGKRRRWMADHLPTGILWLPRFAYQRSPTTGKWTTDSVCACWVIWLRKKSWEEPKAQFIRYAPTSVIDELDRMTSAYRSSMDQIMAAREGAPNAARAESIG